jgi:hypothetical protein
MPKNLWPDFDIGHALPSPKTIIEQAGDGLREKTGGALQFYRMSLLVRENIADATYSLYSATLSYHFPFLRAQFSVDSGYPVTLTADKMTEVVAKDETELLASLAKIFNAPTTVDTIQRLMSLTQQ